MKWNDSNIIYPKQTCEIQDEIFCISDGKEIGLAIWVNLCSENPDCGADQDEYDFKIIGGFIEPKFWVGPISKSIFCALIYSEKLELPKKVKKNESIL
jgi:hypothetical protein